MFPSHGRSDPSNGPLTLITLGGWELLASRDATPTPLFGPSKPLALIVYLALSPGRSAAREHLLDLLWADLEPVAANHAYRQTVWYIRQRLGEGCLKAGGSQLTLVAPLEADRDLFLAAVHSQDWDRAVSRYTGDFLPGFGAPGGAEFERWADLERWRVRSLFVRAGDTLARRLLATGRAREAVALARRVRDTDRAAEAGWRLLLEALAAAGDPVGVSVEADQLEEMLREDGRDPEPATRSALRLARQESRETAEVPAQRGLVAELVGREREFGAIVTAWEAVRRGEPRHLHITGEAGLGKTRLLADAQTRLKASGTRTVLVRAAPGERSLSYAVAADLATALAAQRGAAAISPATAGTLVGLAPALASYYPAAEPDRSSGDELMRRRVLAMAELLAAVADEGPLALLVDDVHWMDPQSRQLTAALLGRLGRNAVLVVTATRPGVEGALDTPASEHLVLEPLTVPQVSALVASFAALPDEPWARTLAPKLRAATKGTPLIVLETLELALERGVLDLDPTGWHCPAPGDLESLLASGAALRQRLERITAEQRWLLLVFAVHGTPLMLDEIRAITLRADDALQADLTLLEARALASRERGGWQPAHDAIAELVIELAPADAVQETHRNLGRVVAERAGGPDALPRAAQHFAAAGDTAALDGVFKRWLRAARARGDRRGLRPLAEELLGPTATSDIEALVQSAPPRYRLGFVTPARIAATAALLLVAAFGIAFKVLARDDVAVRAVGLVPDGDGLRPVQIRITEQDLRAQRTFDLSAGSAVPDLPKRLDSLIGLSYLGHDTWAWVKETGPLNGEEAAIFTRQRETRLPPAPGDDAIGSESPDGRYLAVYTDRWSPDNAGDVGIYDLLQHSLRQLTSGPTRDMPGPWSPDGTRVAFVRHHYDLQPDELCWVTFDGKGHSCFAPERWSATAIVGGWISAHEFAALGIDSTGRTFLYAVNIDARTSSRLFEASVAVGVGDTPWILCRCGASSGPADEWELRRIDIPGEAIRLIGAAALSRVPVLALPRRETASPRYLDHLILAGPTDGTVAPGVPFRYVAGGLAPDGSGVEVPVMHWEVADRSIASISPEGTLTGRRPGRTWVSASAGGWRRDSVAVTVVAHHEVAALSEAWTKSWPTRWRVYGEPAPRVVAGPVGPSLFVAGDSDYYSGVYSRDAFVAAGGLGIRVTLRTPVPRGKWQMLRVGLVPFADPATIARWDHRTANLPLSGSDLARDCEANYPTGEALWGRRFVALSADRIASYVPVDTAIAHGRPWVLTLQLMPDGRCGVAVNGKALRVADVRLPIDAPRHIVIDGQSVRTQILVDHLEVWRGVRHDIDWRTADSSRTHH